LSLRLKGTYQVLALVPVAVAACTPGDVVETSLSSTFRKATVKTCTVSVFDGWLSVTATVTGWVPFEGFGKIAGVVTTWGVEVAVDVAVKLAVAEGVGVAGAIVTVDPVTGNPLN
jgi:hypothetical protein